MSDTRNAIVEWAKWLMEHKAQINYSEGTDRLNAVGIWPPKFPINTDCSGFITLCFWLAGAPDPTNRNYASHEGYTGTELSIGTEIPKSLIEPGDAIVYGPGTGWHTALIVEAGEDPLTISHGQQGDPSYVRVSQDGRQPQRYLRFKTEGTLRTPAQLTVNKVATPDLHKTALQVHQTAPEAPHTAPAPTPAPTHPEQQFAPTSPATIGWPLLKEIEHIAETIVKGPEK